MLHLKPVHLCCTAVPTFASLEMWSHTGEEKVKSARRMRLNMTGVHEWKKGWEPHRITETSNRDRQVGWGDGVSCKC